MADFSADYGRGIEEIDLEAFELETNRDKAFVSHTGQLVKQTHLQQELLEEMRRLVAFARSDEHRIVGIHAGKIEAQNVVIVCAGFKENMSKTRRITKKSAREFIDNLELVKPYKGDKPEESKLVETAQMTFF